MQKIKIDGKTYMLDTKKAKELSILQDVEEYQVGVRVVAGNDWYIIAHVEGNKIALINLKSGNRRSDPVVVEDFTNITKPEWDKITGGEPQTFTVTRL